jgi:hypothetical protein
MATNVKAYWLCDEDWSVRSLTKGLRQSIVTCSRLSGGMALLWRMRISIKEAFDRTNVEFHSIRHLPKGFLKLLKISSE